MKVGFIGLGIMGKPMCKNLMKAGYEMVVTTHNKETLKEMEALGAKTVTCGREVAEEDGYGTEARVGSIYCYKSKKVSESERKIIEVLIKVEKV